MLKRLKKWVRNHTNRQIGTYMDRWYIIPPSWNLPICVRLQHIKRADQERLPHNHPYAFKSIVLKGWYDEDKIGDFPPELEPGCEYMAFPFTVVRHNPFKVFLIEQKRYHRITDMSKGGVWTLIWHPRKAKESEWGYLNVDGTHIPHAEYVRPPGFDLPYKPDDYRRQGPTGARGPGGPNASPGVDGPGGPASHVIDTSDTLDLLSKITDAANTTKENQVELHLHGKKTRCAGSASHLADRGLFDGVEFEPPEPLPESEAPEPTPAPKEWFMTETVLPVQCSPEAEARIKKFLADGGTIKGERI